LPGDPNAARNPPEIGVVVETVSLVTLPQTHRRVDRIGWNWDSASDNCVSLRELSGMDAVAAIQTTFRILPSSEFHFRIAFSVQPCDGELMRFGRSLSSCCQQNLSTFLCFVRVLSE